MSEYVYAGLTSQTIDLFIRDSSSTTGQGLTGLAYNSGSLVASYRKGATGSRTAITLATQTVGGAWSSGGFVEIDATNMPGCYRLDLPNAAVDTAGFVTVFLKGAANMVPVALRIDCRALPVDVKQFGGTNGTFSSGVPTAALDTATTTKINDIKAKTDTLADQTLILLSDGTNGRQVKVTAAKHIAADVHDVQQEALAKFASDDTGETVAANGSVAKLSQGSASGGGDATLAKQEEILTALDELSALQLAAVEVNAGTISGFPETIIIGDSYSSDTGQIRINIENSVTGDPIDSLGSLEFAHADVSFTAFRPNDSARITGICEYVREPSSGTLTASYVLITLLTSETAKGKAEYTYEGRLKFVWQGPSSSDETDEEQKTYKTTPFKFIANP